MRSADLTPIIANWLMSPGGNGRNQGASVLMRSAQGGCKKGTSVRSPAFKCFTAAPTATTRPTPSLALWQGARVAATAHRMCEHCSQVVVSTCPSEYRWVVHCTQSPTCPHGRSALSGFCKRGANPRVEMPSGSYFLDIPYAYARR